MSTATVLDQVIAETIRREAGALHFVPERNAYAVRLRLGTALVPCNAHPTVVAGVVAEMSRRANLDLGGRQTVDAGGALWRISSTLTIAGPHLDLRRVLANAPGLDRIGFTPDQLAAVTTELGRARGATLFCGPPGTGKTSTLYAALRAIDRSARVVVTLEDPIEARLDGIAQRTWPTPVQSPEDVVRSIVEQNPDVVGLGVIDSERTARIAMELTACGIKVLATMAATNATMFSHRLIRHGQEPYAFVPNVRQVVCQRVLRLSCRDCAAKGCARCDGTGFAGSTAIFEVLEVGVETTSYVLQGASFDDIETEAVGRGMITLRRRAEALVEEGRVTAEEAQRVL